MRVDLEAVAIARGSRRLLDGLSLQIEPGTVTVLAGPNGVGKSTLLDCLAGELVPAAGRVQLDGVCLSALPLAARAARRAMLCQQSLIAFDFAVADIVAMGLHPHGVPPASAAGRALLARALADMDLGALASRPATRLSGGEAQRVHLARCLVQLRAGAAGGLLLLDEPTTGLDYRHQLALIRLLRAEAAAGATIIASLHDLPLALRLADRLLFLAPGELLADVRPDEVDPQLVARLFDIATADAAELMGRPALPQRAACHA